MQTDSSFSDLIGAIYQGAIEEQPWQAFLSQLRELMTAVNTTLVLRPPSAQGTGVLLTDGGSLESIASYNESLFVFDPFVDLQVGEVKTLLELIDEDDLLDSELYKVCMAPAGLHDSLGADMSVPGELEACLRVARSRDSKAFDADDRQLIKMILPHLERAILIHARLNKIESERALYAGAVEQLSVGSIILDENARLLSCNTMARQLVDKQDGLQLVKDSLRLSSKDANGELQAVIAEVLVNQRQRKPAVVGAMRVQRPSGLQDLALVIRPVPINEWSEGESVPSVAVFISDPEQISEAPRQTITRLFGFTPAEANLAMLLANGQSLDEASQQLSISRNTARTHLRSVFAKTGVERQASLVRLILKSVAPLG